MSQIKVDTEKLASIRATIQQQEQRMLHVSNSIQRIASEMNLDVSTAGEINECLSHLKAKSATQNAQLGDLASLLTRVSDTFSQADKAVAQEAKGANYLMENAVFLSKSKGSSISLLQNQFRLLTPLFGMVVTGVSTVPLAMSWLSSFIKKVSEAGNSNTSNLIPPENTITECVGDGCTVPDPTPVPTPAPPVYPYSKADADSKKRVADLSTSYYSDGYMKPNASGYKYQCTSYVYCRVREKYGLGALTGSNYGKDVASTFKSWANKSSLVDSDGSHYRLISGRDGQYKVKAYTGDGGSKIISDSWVSFSRRSNKAGHVVYVESVQIENGTKYVYYSEGGTGYHNAGTDGVIKRLPFDAFMHQSDYTYTGCVTFEKA